MMFNRVGVTVKGRFARRVALIPWLVGLVACGGSRPANEPLPVAAARPGELPVKAFAALPLIEDLTLSPSGDYLAFIQNTDGHSALVTQNRSGGDSRVVITSDNQKYHIRGFTWVNNQRLLVRMWYPDRVSDLKFTQTRLFAINRDGSELKSDLVRFQDPVFGGRRHIPQFQDAYALIPGDERHILLMLDERQQGAPDVYRLDVYSGERETVAGNPGYVRRWLADLQGHVRVGLGLVGGSTERIVYRSAAGGDWQTLFEHDAVKEDGMQPLGFDADPDILYLRGPHQGRSAIFRMHLSAPKSAPELVYADPRYDVTGGLMYSSAGNRVLGVHYRAATAKSVFWDEDARLAQAKIDQALPDRDNAVISSAGNQVIVLSSGPSHAPAYYWLNMHNNQMGRLIDSYPLLANQTLAASEIVHFKARDGLELEGYLTKPRQAGATAGPAVVFPHGGPWSRDSHGFNPWTQFLADRGWTVLQLNFRGSAGYGNDFETAGFRRWGLEMQDDITDGVRWLTEQKLVDPAKVCIVGASYGGYAALMGAIKTPELYRCAVSLAPVTDLRRLLDEWGDMRWQDHRLRAEMAEKTLGHWWSDRARLKDTSPVEQAARLHTPLLLAHGVGDWTVNVGHSRDMADALASAGFKDVRYVEMEDADHYLTREEDRLRFFGEMDAFLRRFR